MNKVLFRRGAFALLLGTLVFASGCTPAADMFSQFQGSQSGTVGSVPPPPTAITSPGSSPSSPPPSCTHVTLQTYENLRIMFMVDDSNSTKKTDKKNYYRVQTLTTFYQTYSMLSNLTYGFSYFAQTASTYDTTKQNFVTYDTATKSFDGALTTPFGTATDLSNALTTYTTQAAPASITAYGAAFGALNQAIQIDENAGVKQNYVVVFMSDGQPTDLGPDAKQVGAIRTLVDNLRTTVQSNQTSLLTVSAVYFGPEDSPVPITNLQAMADEGLGQFVDTNQLDGDPLTISDIINVPGQVCPGD